MAESIDIPEKLGPLLRWVVANLAWILPLVALEQLAEERYRFALYFGIAAGLDIAIGATFHVFTNFLRRWRGNMTGLILIAIGLCGALGLGIAIGGLLIRWPAAVAGAPATGRITWSFDQPGDNYFLAMSRLNDQEIRVAGFQAHGKNTSPDPITEFSGYIRSDLTNAERPIYLQAQDQTDINRPPFMVPVMVPTSPDQTYGIPGLADFDIATFEKPFIETGVDGEPVSQFLRDFGPFTLVLKYDGKTIERHFTSDQIKAQVALLDKQSGAHLANVPRVTRKPTAPPVRTLPLFPPRSGPAPAPAPTSERQPPSVPNGSSN